MPLTYHFKCSNGHEFDAVAKLRSRCPECQTMTFRKSGLSLGTSTTSKLTHGEKEIEVPSTASSQGAEVPTVSDIGSSLAKPLKKSDEESRSQISKPKARILRQGRVPSPKKPVAVVKKKIAAVHTIPRVNAKPEGSRQHKVDMPDKRESYGMSMMHKHFGFGKRPS
jgi:hypothetical protein